MRFLLYILALLLLVPLIFSSLIWLRSHRISDNLTLDTARNDSGKWNHLQRGLYTGRGRFIYYIRPWATYREAGHPPKTGWNLAHYAPTDPDTAFPNYSTGHGRFGFWLARGSHPLLGLHNSLLRPRHPRSHPRSPHRRQGLSQKTRPVPLLRLRPA